jgi:hypothetical protein
LHFTDSQRMIYSQAIFDCLADTPSLVTDLPGARIFERSLLAMPAAGTCLKFEQKLGHLIEDAVAAMIEASESLQLIARNLQLQGEDGNTLGEMDFILRDDSRKVHVHLEVALKFYLVHKEHKGTDGAFSFPGPDARDNWPRKLQRLTTHQLRLSDRSVVKSTLLQSFGIEQIEVAHAIYGCLFDHIDAQVAGVAPAIDNAGCRRGRWLRISEIEKLGLRGGERMTIVPKPLWPVPLTGPLLATLPDVSQEQLLSSAQQRCVMFTTSNPEKPHQPMFMVADSWPGQMGS